MHQDRKALPGPRVPMRSREYSAAKPAVRTELRAELADKDYPASRVAEAATEGSWCFRGRSPPTEPNCPCVLRAALAEPADMVVRGDLVDRGGRAGAVPAFAEAGALDRRACRDCPAHPANKVS